MIFPIVSLGYVCLHSVIIFQVDELENAVMRQSEDTSSVLTTPESKKQPASSKPTTPGQQVKIDMVRFWKPPLLLLINLMVFSTFQPQLIT